MSGKAGTSGAAKGQAKVEDPPANAGLGGPEDFRGEDFPSAGPQPEARPAAVKAPTMAKESQLPEGWLDNLCPESSHRPALAHALSLTRGPILELGAGEHSTPWLAQHAIASGKFFLSCENSFDYHRWAQEALRKLGEPGDGLAMNLHVLDWDLAPIEAPPIPYQRWGVVLIDHRPGERRWIDIARAAKSADIVVVHDSQPEATGYMLEKIWHLFKYRKDFPLAGSWSTAVSLTIPL